ncbi:hypothetical protein ACFX1X_038394 [Malus domestica]
MCGYHGLEVIDGCSSKVGQSTTKKLVVMVDVQGPVPMVKSKCMLPIGCTISSEKLIRREIEQSSKCSATLSAQKASADMILTKAPVSTRIRLTSKLAM